MGRFEKAIDYLTKLGMRDETAMLHIRTGQYATAEQLLPARRSTSRFQFDWFYLLYWRREIDAARDYYRGFDPGEIWLLNLYWVCFLLGDFDAGIEHLEADIQRGAPPAVFRSNIGEALPQSILKKLEEHPRYQAILGRFGIDDAWRDELMKMGNDVRAITGICVQPDDGY